MSSHTNAEARAWLGREVSNDGLDAAALDAPSPYAIPSHAISNGVYVAAVNRVGHEDEAGTQGIEGIAIVPVRTVREALDAALGLGKG